MMTNKNITLFWGNENNGAQRTSLLTGLLLIVIGMFCFNAQIAYAAVNCSVLSCASTDQTTIIGEQMFDETNFDPVVDGFGRTRKFYVHIPPSYDTLTVDQKMPLIFAFHGGGQDRSAMVTDKWADFYNQKVAFVIPLAEIDPCDTIAAKRAWMGVNVGVGLPAGAPVPVNCNPATQRETFPGSGIFVTYWDATMTGSFTDVLFIENLRSIILSRFPKLNAEKVYATGFSSGGGLTNSLLCYRAGQFRGFSVVAKTIHGENGRGDFDGDALIETDPNSLVATCGKSQYDPGHATGISSPMIWGEGKPLPFAGINFRRTKPVALFVGDQDTHYTLDDINATGIDIRARNNLNGSVSQSFPFMDLKKDDAQTQLRIFNTVDVATAPFSAFSRYYVQKIDDGTGTFYNSGDHSMPDANECPNSINDKKMTCDYSYTDQTMAFFQMFADLNLNP